MSANNWVNFHCTKLNLRRLLAPKNMPVLYFCPRFCVNWNSSHGQRNVSVICCCQLIFINLACFWVWLWFDKNWTVFRLENLTHQSYSTKHYFIRNKLTAKPCIIPFNWECIYQLTQNTLLYIYEKDASMAVLFFIDFNSISIKRRSGLTKMDRK